MKNTKNLTSPLIACALAFAMVSTVGAQTAIEGAAKVVRIKGPARYTTGNNVWQPLKVGAVLKPGTIVQTSNERDSFVDLVLGEGNAPLPSPASRTLSIPNSMSSSLAYQPSADQNVVRVWENTALGIDKLISMQTGAELVSDTQLDLKAGHITGSVKKMAATSKYEIKLPNGVAGIRGTIYDLTADGVVRVVIGSVVIAWVDPKTGNVVTQVVMGGQQYDARTAQISPLPPGEVQSIEKMMPGMRVAPGGTEVLYVPDKTVQGVSPVGPSTPPPSTPPIIPAGAGH
jgi:hypothetical protein